MTELFAPYLIALTFLALASVTDIKTKEVPYSISYSFIIFAVLFRIVFSLNTWSFTPLLEGLYGFLIFFAIGYLLYKINLWGGADATLLFAMGILFGFTSIKGFMPNFLLNLMIVGGFYGILYCFYKGIKENLDYKSPKIIRKVYFLCSILLLIGYFSISDNSLKISYFFLILMIPVSVLLINYTKQVQEKLLIRKVKIPKLTEGDWISEDIIYNKKVIARKSDNGLSLKQLEELNKLYNENKLKEVYMKEGMPFIPSFLISLIITYQFGNILLLLI